MSILYVQQALKAAGFDPGPADGKWGPKTQAALAAALRMPVEAVGGEPAADDFDANTKLLISELERDEGRVLHAYKDSLGFLTIGIGRLIDKAKGGGITDAEADYLKANDIRRIQRSLDAGYPEWRQLDPVRQRAMQNMAFQLGTGWPAKFARTYAAIKEGRYEAAADMLSTSLWARQTPARAQRVIKQWRNG